VARPERAQRIDYDEWQLRSYEEVKATHPALFAAWLTTPHLIKFPIGESLQDLVARSADALRFILYHHPDETVIAVGMIVSIARYSYNSWISRSFRLCTAKARQASREMHTNE